jgi:hypothetical protein
VSPAISLALALVLGVDPYVRTRVTLTDPNSHCLLWADPRITFVQDMVGSSDVADRSEFAAFSSSLATWQAAAKGCSSLDLKEGPRVSDRNIGWVEGSPDNQNVVLYRQRDCDTVVPAGDSCWGEQTCQNQYDCWDGRDGSIALTTTTYYPDTGRIYDADIEANDARFYFTTVDDPPCADGVISQSCVVTDVQNTMTHELGHALGLDHAAAQFSTMYFNADPGETSKRVLDSGSAQFLCDAYPKKGVPMDCVTVRARPHLGEGSGCALAPGGVLAGLLALGAACTLCMRSKRRRG